MSGWLARLLRVPPPAPAASWRCPACPFTVEDVDPAAAERAAAAHLNTTGHHHEREQQHG